MRIKNIAWNLAGLVAPLVIAVMTIPVIIQQIGLERFGLLALAWGLIGFAGIFDLGIGRAVTQLISKRRGIGDSANISSVIRTGSRLSLQAGLAGTALFVVAVLLEAPTLINYSPRLASEVTMSSYIIAIAIPFQSLSAMYRGVNEAFESFRNISLIRICLGVANFAGPYLVSLVSSNLSLLVGTLLLSRVIAFSMFRRSALSCVAPSARSKTSAVRAVYSKQIERELLSFGGWVTVSSLISPLLVQADRFVIGALVSATAVAAYSIPADIVSQNLVIVGAISTTLFPTLTALLHSNQANARKVFRIWLIRTATLMLVVTSVCALILPDLLRLWIGSALPVESGLIGRVLCFGIFCNSVGAMFYVWLHANGRADTTAKLHLLEAPVFFAALYVLVTRYGAIGASVAWSGRMALDATLLWLRSRAHQNASLMPGSKKW